VGHRRTRASCAVAISCSPVDDRPPHDEKRFVRKTPNTKVALIPSASGGTDHRDHLGRPKGLAGGQLLSQ
jgi:hypothetical protein